MDIFVHDIKLEEKDDFSRRFNVVGELFEVAKREDNKEAWDAFYEAKYCLEMGLPL